jgi:gas vesicle protein
MNTKSVLIGVAVGAVAALLFAPQKGKYLRGEIKRRVAKTTDDMGEYIHDVADKASDAMRIIKKKTA